MRALITRRDLIGLLGGGAVGALLTPLPWKLTDDVSIWTQNWSWLPRLPRGHVETKRTTCGLCPEGCPLRVRCTAGIPFQIAAAGGGAICLAGLGGHHLAWHPRRLRGPVARRAGGAHEPIPIADALDRIARRIRHAEAEGSRVAVLDARPDRAISAYYRAFLSQVKGGLYLEAPRREERSLRALASMMEPAPAALGWDLDNARTILSFGAPILDGWCGGRCRIEDPVSRRRRNGAGSRIRIIQAEARSSRTAQLADLWLPIRPGTEAALALGIAHVIVRENPDTATALRERAADFEADDARGWRDLVGLFPPDRVAGITGLCTEQIVRAARAFALDGPALAVGGGDPGGGPPGPEEETAIQGLNLLAGSVGRAGGVVPREVLPAPAVLDGSALAPAVDLHAAPEGCVRVLLIDGSPSGDALPWPAVRRLLCGEHAIVVSFSPYLTGTAAHADYVLPAPAHFEALEEAATAPGSARASFAATAPMLRAPAEAVDRAAFVAALASATGHELPDPGGDAALVEARGRAIHAAGRGTLVRDCEEGAVAVSSVSADEMWRSILDGARWIDAPSDPIPPRRIRLLGAGVETFDRLAAIAGAGAETPRPSPAEPVLAPFGLSVAAGDGPVSPLVSKVYRESRLMAGPGRVAIHPETAAACGLHAGARARIETAAGSIEAIVEIDRAAMPGVIHAPTGPDPDRLGEEGPLEGEAVLAACADREGNVRRATPARIREA